MRTLGGLWGVAQAAFLMRLAENLKKRRLGAKCKCAKRGSICIALLLLIRDLCLKLGAVKLTGDFNKKAEREARQTDLLTIAAPVSVKWHSASPTSHGLLLALRRCGAQAVSSMTVRGPNAVGSWSFPSHRVTGFSCVMVRLMFIGLRTTKQTWHYEQ